MSDVFTLNCWVRGTDTNRVSCVKISRFETVDDLKRLLKEYHAIDGPASALELYKPRDPVAQPFDENLRSVVLSELGEPLSALDDLSDLFPAAPPKKHIHIIIDAPLLVIYFWLRGSTVSDRFHISISPDASMGDLKDRMKEKVSQLNNIDQNRMRLYSISESQDELQESLDTLNAGRLLDVTQTRWLFDHFLDVPVLEPLRVVVQVSSDNRSTNPWQANYLIEGEDPIKTARDTFIKNLDDHFKRSKRSRSPSCGSHPSSFHGRQRDKKLQIACGRPRDLEESIPVTLLNSVFGQFIDDCRTHTITEEDNNLVYELANIMSALYETEDERVNAVSDVLSRYRLDFRLNSEVQGTGYVTDADMSVDVHNNRHPYVIAEFKNEAGSEPYVQAIVDYLESTRMFASKLSGSALPCFLLILFGPYAVFAGAVWTLRPAVQILSSPLVFNYHSTDTNNQIAAARHMAAFRKAVRSLKGYYETLPPESELTNMLSHPIPFPYPTSFTSLDDSSETCFKYTGQLNEDGASKRLIFFGILTGRPAEDAICIKFVQHYSRDVHLHFASSGLAPRLRGFEELPGGWYMVVMDKLVGYDVLADLPNSERLPRSAFEPIRERLKKLHAENLIHGDLRDTNILVKKDDRTKFMIIDFDWAGAENIVRYPPYVNYTNIKRPSDARDGLLIKAAHDDAMLDIIMDTRARE
ncbi:hypothetical protein BDR04DRAFT_1108553 [Suillus decipiens]|nr:hypothetical protein BDR04DRAFT_1108553 [Suillus decipiens]